MLFFLTYNILGEHIQRRFSTPVPSRATDQAAPTGLYYSDTALDICAEFQSLTLRVPSHSHAVLHLCHYWDAGEYAKLNSRTCIYYI